MSFLKCSVDLMTKELLGLHNAPKIYIMSYQNQHLAYKDFHTAASTTRSHSTYSSTAPHLSQKPPESLFLQRSVPLESSWQYPLQRGRSPHAVAVETSADVLI
jgi:hypothetical protein